MRAKQPAVTDHSRSTEGWHNLQDCAVCLKTFLPQRYEERLRMVKAEKERIRKAAAPKETNRGKAPGSQITYFHGAT